MNFKKLKNLKTSFFEIKVKLLNNLSNLNKKFFKVIIIRKKSLKHK